MLFLSSIQKVAEGKTGEPEDGIYKRLSIRIEIEELFEDDRRLLIFHIPSRPIGATLRFEGVPLMRIGDSLRVNVGCRSFSHPFDDTLHGVKGISGITVYNDGQNLGVCQSTCK